jgi:glutaryl-CoA dehydrogenase
MWITNGTLADVAVVWARVEDPSAESGSTIRGFVVPTGTPGFSAHKIERKLSLRASVTAELTLDDVRLPADAVFPEVRGLKGPLTCLNEARYGILWGAVGAARACYTEALEYTKQRHQFGKPLASFQLIQEKLATMLTNVTASLAMVTSLTQAQDEGVYKDENSAMAKMFTARMLRETAALAREVCGGNGIVLDYDVARFHADAEAIYSYEGTDEINALILGRAITGIGAFR